MDIHYPRVCMKYNKTRSNEFVSTGQIGPRNDIIMNFIDATPAVRSVCTLDELETNHSVSLLSRVEKQYREQDPPSGTDRTSSCHLGLL